LRCLSTALFLCALPSSLVRRRWAGRAFSSCWGRWFSPGSEAREAECCRVPPAMAHHMRLIWCSRCPRAGSPAWRLLRASWFPPRSGLQVVPTRSLGWRPTRWDAKGDRQKAAGTINRSNHRADLHNVQLRRMRNFSRVRCLTSRHNVGRRHLLCYLRVVTTSTGLAIVSRIGEFFCTASIRS
jgi:hypothetical protein